MSIYDWIETRVPGGHDSPFGRLLDTAYNIEYGAETKSSPRSTSSTCSPTSPRPRASPSFGVSDERYHIRGGNQRLPKRSRPRCLAVQLECRLTAITGPRRRHGGARAFSHHSRPEEVVADRVILTLPFAVLRTLDLRRPGSTA